MGEVEYFTDADLSIEAKENRLTIRGEKQTNDEEKTGEVLYRGIAARTFERSFQLADHVEVKGASLQNGLLHVDLGRRFLGSNHIITSGVIPAEREVREILWGGRRG